MPARQPPEQRQGSLRRTIAALAARLIAEEGIQDYALAKRKAARQLGFPERDLPTNTEVEEELQSWRSLFRDEEDDERLEQAREAAVEVMRALSPFRPYLTGTVLEGTADAFCEVELELYVDSAKDVEIFLMDQRIRYEHREIRRGGHDAPEAVLEFDWDGVPIKLSIFDHVLERSARRSAGGRALERVRLEAFEQLLVRADEDADE
jgi:hypothetical protein